MTTLKEIEEPSPSVIRERTLEIQSTWSKRIRKARTVQLCAPTTVPEIEVPYPLIGHLNYNNYE